MFGQYDLVQLLMFLQDLIEAFLRGVGVKLFREVLELKVIANHLKQVYKESLPALQIHQEKRLKKLSIKDLYSVCYQYFSYQMNNRRKPFELQMKKNQYRSHLKKLQEISKSDNQLHRSILKERQEMDDMIRNSHQLHSYSMKVELRRREKTQIETQRSNYDNVRSCLKRELNRKILTIPDRHQPDSYFLDIANMKLVDKILNVKSQFNFRQGVSSRLVRLSMGKKDRANTNQDFTDLYKNSMVKLKKTSQICLRINRAKDNIKLKVRFLDKQAFLPSKNQNLYFIILETDSKKKKSKSYTLDEIFSSELILEVPPKDCNISFVQKIGERGLLRYKIDLKQKDLLHQETTWVSKPIQDGKGRAIGVVEIELKKKNLRRVLNSNMQNIVIQDKQKTGEITQNQTTNAKQ